MRSFADISARSEAASADVDRAETNPPHPAAVYVVDDDFFARTAVRAILEDTPWRVEEFSTCEAFLAAFNPEVEACLVVDVHFPGMGGLQLLQRLQGLSCELPCVVMSGSSGISEAVQSLKTGAYDFLEKPVAPDQLLISLSEALKKARDAKAVARMHRTALDHIAGLTPRQREIMRLVLAGHPSKNIASDLGISQRTVENHRASIMHKTGARSLPALAKLALSSVWGPDQRLAGF